MPKNNNKLTNCYFYLVHPERKNNVTLETASWLAIRDCPCFWLAPLPPVRVGDFCWIPIRRPWLNSMQRPGCNTWRLVTWEPKGTPPQMPTPPQEIIRPY